MLKKSLLSLLACTALLPQHSLASGPTHAAVTRASITAESLKTYTQDQLDSLYFSLKSGPMPDGEYRGTIIFDESEDNEVEKVLAILSPYGIGERFLKDLGRLLWKGKVFDASQGTLTNRVGLIRRFPAAVYCGQSLLDSRRESIVLDYAFADKLDGYIPAIDWVVTRYGLSIRDEIRMIRPGLYLGRAYVRNNFALNFVLEKAPGDDAELGDSACRG